MDEPPPDFRLMQFSTTDLPSRDRFEIWRDLLSRKLFGAAIDSLTDHPFHAKAAMRARHGVRVGSGVTAGSICRHTRGFAASDNDDVFLVINVSGPLLVEQRGATLDLGAGDATLITCAEPVTLIRPRSGRVTCVRLPYSALGALAPSLDGGIARLIPSHSPQLKLLTSYVDALVQIDGDDLSPETSRLVVQHILDLTALACGVGADLETFAAGRGVRAARLRAIKAFIDDNLAGVTIDEVAATHGISNRYVRRLFQDERTTFADYVVEQRLARAHAMLISPRDLGRTIASVAFDVGFNDLSHFNRAFKRRYLAAPREVRAHSHPAPTRRARSA